LKTSSSRPSLNARNYATRTHLKKNPRLSSTTCPARSSRGSSWPLSALQVSFYCPESTITCPSQIHSLYDDSILTMPSMI
jgi:hypothetical protein